MKFNIGNYVTPLESYICSGRIFLISEIDYNRNSYKLEVPYFRKKDKEDEHAINCIWFDYEIRGVSSATDDAVAASIGCTESDVIAFKPTIQLDNGMRELKEKFQKEARILIKESEEFKMKNILEIYKERKREKLDNEHIEKKKALKEQDKISQIIAETNRLIQEIEPTRVFPVISSGIYTTETLEKEKEIDQEYKKALKELDELIEEVEGYFAMTSDFTERKTILRNYDIIDKKGKLII